MFVFCFKQKTAYELRISDWSSDVCSSDLVGGKRDTKENGHDFVSLEKSPLSTPFSLELPRAADGRRRGYCPAARGGSMPPSAACLAKKGKRGPGGCRSLSRVNSGAALLTLRCRTLSLAVEIHHVQQIGRASCRESVCQYVEISVVAVSLK